MGADQLARGDVGAVPWTSGFGPCLGLLSEGLQRRLLGACSWEGHQWAHSLLAGTASTPHPLWELMAFQKGRAEVWREGSLVWCRHLPGFWAGFSPLRPLLPSEGQCSPGRLVSRLGKGPLRVGGGGQTHLGREGLNSQRGRGQSRPCRGSLMFSIGSCSSVPPPGN